MASKKDYDKQVTKRVRSQDALDKFMSGRTVGTVADRRRVAAKMMDNKNETKVRGYVRGSLGDPAVGRRITAAQKAKKSAKRK